jgi:hypothetical protein
VLAVAIICDHGAALPLRMRTTNDGTDRDEAIQKLSTDPRPTMSHLRSDGFVFGIFFGFFCPREAGGIDDIDFGFGRTERKWAARTKCVGLPAIRSSFPFKLSNQPRSGIRGRLSQRIDFHGRGQIEPLLAIRITPTDVGLLQIDIARLFKALSSIR